MKARRIATVVGAGALVVTLVGAPSTHASPGLDCPAGYDLTVVAELVAAGYHVAPAVDDPSSGVETFGRPGNGNGLICIRQMGNRTTHFGGPYYLFTDDGLRSS